MKTQKLGHLMLCIMTCLAACSDNTQFTEHGLPAAQSTGEMSGSDANTVSSDSVVADSEAAPTVEVSTETIDQTVSASDAISKSAAPAVEFKQATSSGSGLKTNDTTATASPLSTAQRDAILSLCGQGEKKTIKRQIRFPEQANCQWSKDGNLARKDAYLQAAEAQSSSIELPSNTQLCGLSIGSQAGTLHYDDFIILTLNGYVLLSSNQKLLSPLSGTADTAYQWDFAKVRGQAVDFNSPAFCMGAMASSCQVPVTDIPGKFSFEIDPTSLLHLADRIFDQRSLNFSLIGTGDNDDRDCFHTDMTLEFTLQYIEK